jgi:thiamine biosynthesis protein ThiS
MNVTVNGEARDVPAGLTVAGLLRQLGIASDRVAIERNLAILPRAIWDDTPVESDDRYEIVHLVGGGVDGSAAQEVQPLASRDSPKPPAAAG